MNGEILCYTSGWQRPTSICLERKKDKEIHVSLTILSSCRANMSTIASEHDLYMKLLDFIHESKHYHIDRLFGLLPSDGKL